MEVSKNKMSVIELEYDVGLKDIVGAVGSLMKRMLDHGMEKLKENRWILKGKKWV